MGKEKNLSMEDMVGSEESKYNALINQDNRDRNDEIASKAIDELLDQKKLKTISRVKFDQVGILSKLYLFADIFDVDLTKNLADLILKLQISTNGLGRKELVQLVQQRTDIFDMSQIKKSSKDIFR